MSEKIERSEPRVPAGENSGESRDDDVIRIEDLAPPPNVRGGRKILLGEIVTPASNPRTPPGS